jgi:opacity protein-like surface antigen
MIHFGFNFYLTDLESFVRPYAGLGVGYRSSTLEENFPSGTRGAGGAFLNQTSFGANLNFGLQFRFSDAIRSMAAFRYYRPVINSDPEFDRGSTLNYFNLSDTKLTSAPLRQLVASLQYVF